MKSVLLLVILYTSALGEREKTVGNAINRLSYKCIKDLHLRKPGENVFLSGFSIANVLGMAITQSDNYKSTAIFDYLHPTEIHTGIAKLNHDIAKKQGNTTLSLLNLAYFDQPSNPKHLDSLEFAYKTRPEKRHLAGSDFQEEVNQRVNEFTHRLIPSFLDEPLSPDASMLFVNALYFDSKWAADVEIEDVTKGVFHNFDKTTTQVDMMQIVGGYKKFVYRGGYLTILELPYSEELSMFIVQSKLGLEEVLKVQPGFFEKLKTFVNASADPCLVEVPRFKFEFGDRLEEILKPYDISKRFDGNLHGVHKAVIEVTESGTKAAAATGGVFDRLGTPQPCVRIDQPFMCLIQHKPTLVNVFSGFIQKFDERMRP